MRNVVLLLNWSLFGYMCWAAFDNNSWSQEDLILLPLVTLTPILTLLYLRNYKSSSDSLLGLWIKVKKKKLEDQLK